MFKASGSKMEILMQLEQEFEISTKESNIIFEYIERHPDILDEEESLTREISEPDEKENSMNLLLPGMEYYLNVKRITIILIATVLDCYLTNGMVSIGLTMLGTELQAIIKLKDEKLCLVKEMLREHQKLYDVSDLSRYKLDCINNDIKCHFNNCGICRLKNEQVTTALDNLSDKGVIKKYGNKYKAHIF